MFVSTNSTHHTPLIFTFSQIAQTSITRNTSVTCNTDYTLTLIAHYLWAT